MREVVSSKCSAQAIILSDVLIMVRIRVVVRVSVMVMVMVSKLLEAG